MLKNMDKYWLPFTNNKKFIKNPRLFVSAKDSYYTTDKGQKIFDAVSGLWCVSFGHRNKYVTKAIETQLHKLDYSTAFQMGHPDAFTLAEKLTNAMPDPLNHVFYTNSGSESVDTALKIALAYQKARGKGEKTMFIGRSRGYHGVNFGGLSVGGISPNRKVIAGNTLPAVAHLPHTWSVDNCFSKGQGENNGEQLATALLDLIAIHGSEQIAAVIVEPVAGSGGVLVPPKNYLKTLAKIAKDNDILLIFDEVITAFGRLGEYSASEYFGVTPDIITTAKGLTNGAVPMGAVFVSDDIYNTVINSTSDEVIEFFHGYTYSAHPLAVAAALGSMEAIEKQNMLQKAKDLFKPFEDGLHSLRDLNNIKDIRNIGLMGAIELESGAQIGARGAQIFSKAYDAGFLLRCTGDTIALSPTLISTAQELNYMFEELSKIIKTIK